MQEAEATKPKGTIYYNRGVKCLVRLIVSLMTMRRHHHGDVTVFLEGSHPEGFAEAIKKAFDVEVVFDQNPETGVFVRAVEISMASPYERTVWMDSDTVILKDYSDLFDQIDGYDFSIARFSNWTSHGGIIQRRIEEYRGIVTPEELKAAIDYGPAINCGVYAWKKGSPFFAKWHAVAKKGDKTGMFIPDEVACQVILPQFHINLLDPKYNVSCLYDPGTQDQRILHFHGRKHCKEYPSCKIWLEAFVEALEKDLCGIRKFVAKEYQDRRLMKFINGEFGQDDYVKKVRAILNLGPIPVKVVKKKTEANKQAVKIPKPSHGIDPSLVTIVTACDPNYVKTLSLTYPNWQKYKGVDGYKVLVFINSMQDDDERLEFLDHPNVTIIPWNMEGVTDHRELMLSSFVLGSAKYVETPYWVKLDADSYAVNDNPLLSKKMKDLMFCGHRWGYSWAKHILALDEWAKVHPDHRLSGMPPMFNAECEIGDKYYHPGGRTISFVQFHSTSFTRVCVQLCGERLPVPSHDTYLYYIADRLKLPWESSNFKRRHGFVQGHGFRRVRAQLSEVDSKFQVG